MSEISVIPVESDYDKKRFIEFPYKLYANDSNWVEPLRFDVKNNLDTKKNPFYSHARLKMWIAHEERRGGRQGCSNNKRQPQLLSQ